MTRKLLSRLLGMAYSHGMLLFNTFWLPRMNPSFANFIFEEMITLSVVTQNDGIMIRHFTTKRFCCIVGFDTNIIYLGYVSIMS